jgi:hypothetical protein
MVEKIYDTIKAILYTDFPKNSQGYPEIYDRVIEQWFFGDRQILPSPLGVVLRNTSSNLKDIGFGLREIEYTIGVTIYSSNDDKETSERVVLEAARVAHNILKNHRSMWVCDLCPFCGKLPLSPIHYIDTGVITNVGITSASLPAGLTTGFIFSVSGSGFSNPNAYIRLSKGISGNVNVAEILSSGIGISATTFSNPYSSGTLTISGGSGHVGAATTVLNSYVNNIITNINNFWLETHASGSPPYYDWAGVAYQAVQAFISDWESGIKPSTITSNSKWNTNLNSISTNKADLMRFLQDIQVGDIKPSNDGMSAAFLHSAEFTLKAKEIISVDQFGPNNVNVNAV